MAKGERDEAFASHSRNGFPLCRKKKPRWSAILVFAFRKIPSCLTRDIPNPLTQPPRTIYHRRPSIRPASLTAPRPQTLSAAHPHPPAPSPSRPRVSTYIVICIPATRHGPHEYGCGCGCSTCSLAHGNFGEVFVGISGRKRSSYYTYTGT